MQTQDFEFSDLMMSENFTEKINVLPPRKFEIRNKAKYMSQFKG